MTWLDELTARVAQARRDAEAATPGEWRSGAAQLVAGVAPERFGPDACTYCETQGEPTWRGRRDINGKRMLAHVHTAPEPWWSHGIYAVRPDGDLIVVNDTDEYGYMTAPDAAHIAAWSPAAALRHVEHAERVIRRHRLAKVSDFPECVFDRRFWPCRDIGDLAAAWGVEVDG